MTVDSNTNASNANSLNVNLDVAGNVDNSQRKSIPSALPSVLAKTVSPFVGASSSSTSPVKNEGIDNRLSQAQGRANLQTETPNKPTDNHHIT